MLEKTIRIDEKYTHKFDEFVKNSKGAVQIFDKDLETDPYFYERKRSIERTIQQVDNGEMKMLSNDEFWQDL